MYRHGFWFCTVMALPSSWQYNYYLSTIMICSFLTAQAHYYVKMAERLSMTATSAGANVLKSSVAISTVPRKPKTLCHH